MDRPPNHNIFSAPAGGEISEAAAPYAYHCIVLYDYTRMRVITFVTQKGGSGKTTLVLSCAVAANELGARVLVLDMDPQKTAESWYQTRESPTPKLAAVTAAELPTAVTGGSERFDVILIDTPGPR